MGNCMDIDNNINQTTSINSENDHDRDRNVEPTHNKDRCKLLKLVELFTTSEEEFYEFVSDHTDKFVVVAIDIMLDKTADSKHETDLETMLFHELRDSPELWLDLDTFMKHELKRKLLIGINELQGFDRKILILAHIIAIIATFEEEWNELIPELIDLKVSKDGKLKTLRMIAAWNPDRLKVHSLQIAKLVYSEILDIDDININLFESVSLFRVMNAVIKNVEDISLLMNIMKTTLVFLLKTYIINTKELKLFDTSLNININNSTFNEMECNINESFETAKICLDIIFHIQMNHFDLIPLNLKDNIFFLLNMFLKISANKINLGLIEFPDTSHTTDEWEQKEHDFACVASNIFSIFVGWKKKADTFDYFSRYFKEMNDCYNLIENIISNLNYDTDKSVWSFWPHLLHKLSENYVNYFWHRKDLFIPFLSQKHPKDACFDLCRFREKLYNQEWFAVRWFVRNNYQALYDQFHIPIMEIIFKYLSEYILTSIIMKEDNQMYHHPNPSLVYDIPPTDPYIYDPNNINYNVINEFIPKYQRECLIYGFIKSLKSIINSSYIIPETIICIIYNFYPWIIERFENYSNGNDFGLENEKTVIKLMKSGIERTVYGQINIGPGNAYIHEWTFKILNLSEGQIIIGLDESECKMIESSFTVSPCHYSYSYKGFKYNMGLHGKPYGERFGTNDIITMILDANEKTLRFCKNGCDQKINAEIDQTKTFKMAVSLFFWDQDTLNSVGREAMTHCGIQLISYKCGNKYDN